MAERPEDLNLPNAVITRIIKEAVGAQRGLRAGTRTHGHTQTDRRTQPPRGSLSRGFAAQSPRGVRGLVGHRQRGGHRVRRGHCLLLACA